MGCFVDLVKFHRDLTRPMGPPNDGLVREMGPLISGKSRLVKYYNLARLMFGWDVKKGQ